MNILSESELDTRLAQLFKQTAMEIALEELLEEIVPADNPWWSERDEDEEITQDKAATPINGDFAKFPWLKQISSVLRMPSDWFPIAKRFFKIPEKIKYAPKIAGHAYAYANSDGGGQRLPTPPVKWLQGGLHLELRCEDAPDTPEGRHKITLHVKEDLDADLVWLRWISKEALHGDPNAPLRGEEGGKQFPLERIDPHTYTVVIEFKDIRDRIADVKIAQELETIGGGGEPLYWLPFVEFVEME